MPQIFQKIRNKTKFNLEGFIRYSVFPKILRSEARCNKSVRWETDNYAAFLIVTSLSNKAPW